jgi:hypothetical protein
MSTLDRNLARITGDWGLTGGTLKISRRHFVTAASALLAACATARAPANPQAETTVRVENQSTMDMNIYVLRGAERIRLGTVTAVSTSVLKIPNNLIFGATPLRFLADPIGSSKMPVSDEIVVAAGDQVTLRIPSY